MAEKLNRKLSGTSVEESFWQSPGAMGREVEVVGLTGSWDLESQGQNF